MRQQGYVVITATLVILLVSLGMISALSFLSVGNLKIAQDLASGDQALFSSDSCLEEGLLRLKSDPLYGGGKVSFPEGDCQISVDNHGDGTYVLDVYFSPSGSVYQRGFETDVEISGGIPSVLDWREKPSVIK